MTRALRLTGSAATVLALAALILFAWWWPNRPRAGAVPMASARFNSLSYAPYRPGQSPFTNDFATPAEVDQDLALLATQTSGIRSYSSVEGTVDLPALARKHHLKLWLGIWLGAERDRNAREIAAGIDAARRYPDVVDRVVVGNEVLLRHDLPPAELIADIDAVKRAVPEPVTTADVWNDFVDHPEIAAHLDIVTIHILPYWEDHPTSLPGTMRHVQHVLDTIRRLFPDKRIAIGETGWPSRGRWRKDAAPGLVNEAIFLRRFIALADREHIDYNFIEAFDQDWKYQSEGVVGANWGIFSAGRTLKFPLHGPVVENPAWRTDAGLSVGAGLVLLALAAAAAPITPTVAGVSMLLGAGFGFAWAGTVPVLYDGFAQVAGIGNLAGQAALAGLALVAFARRRLGPFRPRRTAGASTDALYTLGRLRLPAGWCGPDRLAALLDDLIFVFLWTAAFLQALLVYDPRYRDFPLPTFAVPLLVLGLRALCGDLPARTGRREWVLGLVLGLGAVASAIQEGPRNLQSLGWNAAALLMAMPSLRGLPETLSRGARRF